MAEINNEQPVKSLTIGRKVASQIEAAKKYYSVISAVYDIHLTPMEIGILVYCTIYGTISTPPARKAFIEAYDSSKASLNNAIGKLQREKLLYKDNNLKIRVIPEISTYKGKPLQFDSNKYIFNINLIVE